MTKSGWLRSTFSLLAIHWISLVGVAISAVILRPALGQETSKAPAKAPAPIQVVPRSAAGNTRSANLSFNQATTSQIYVVHPNETLVDIAMKLYGKVQMLPKIAKWNDIPAPYRLFIGQKLVLKERVTRTAREAKKDMDQLDRWRKHFGITEPAEPPLRKVLPPEERAEGKKNFLEVQKVVKAEEEKDKTKEEKKSELYQMRGEKLLKTNRAPAAVTDFKKSRTLNPELIAPYFYEIRALRLLKRDEEAKQTARELLKQYPELSNLPMIRNLLDGN